MGTSSSFWIVGRRRRVRGNQLDLILLMLREFMRERRTVQELADRMDVDRRTVYRYLKIVGRSGVRLWQKSQGQNSFYWVDPKSVRRALGLQVGAAAGPQ